MGDAAPLAPPLANRLPLGARIAIIAVALGLWSISVFAHEVGGQLFARLFHWGQDKWGPDGAQIVERGIFVAGLLMASVVAVATAVRVVRSIGGREAAPELLARWVAWFLFAFAANRFTICLQSEDVHFAQYGFVAFSLALATGKPRLAFIAATFLGFVDESNQWWRMYFHTFDNHLDWNDMILNACGACAGALPFTSFARIRRYAAGKEDATEPGSWPLVLGLVVGLAGLVAFLVAKTDLGHYPAWPFWTELNNKKPFHILTIREGIPALLGVSYLLYYVVDERRRGLPFRALVAAMLAIHLAVVPPRSDQQQDVHETVPRATIPHVAGKAPTIDGKLEKDEWAHAAVLPLRSFAPDATDEQRAEKEQRGFFGPEHETRALVQWDEKALYVAFECASPDVWARKVGRDDPTIPGDSCVELFLDTDGAERTYYEFDLTPANALQDLFVYWPQSPSWQPNPMNVKFVGLNRWDAKGIVTAVSVEGGACDLLEAGDPIDKKRASAPTKGYAVEMAIPWEDLRGRHVPPHAGSVMRANLFRIEIPRPRTYGEGTAIPSGSYLSWSPTRVPLDFHRPQFFGVWELSN